MTAPKPKNLNPEAELTKLIEAYALQKSDAPFTLSSGRESHYFFDLKPVALHARGAALVGDLLCAKLKQLDVQLVGGMETGGIPLVAQVLARMSGDLPLEGGFFVRKKAKGHGTDKVIDGFFSANKNVVLLEDVTTTGGSILKAAKAVEAAGSNVTAILTVVDREEGAEETLTAAGYTLHSLFKLSDFTV